MTFEEFLFKKKINIKQLKQKETELYAELKEHFAMMSHKSFDQIKKYHFNKLRAKYPLQ